jgi:allantoin racemase
MIDRVRLLIVNPNTSASVTLWLAQEAKRGAGEDVEVTAVSAPSGLTAIQTVDELLRAERVVVATIEKNADVDAAIIGAFGDPGLAEARARLPIPVVGLGETGIRAAAADGRRFSIVTLGEAMRAALVERVRSFGLEVQLAEICVLPIPIPDMIANREAHIDAIAGAVRACTGDAILLGGAPLAGLGAKMTEKTGAIVLDGVEASVIAALKLSRGAPVAVY